jgi:sulfate adenylyltransferase subunit 1
LLRVPSIVFAVNKLDALGDDATLAFANISAALETFARAADIDVTATVPISALKGHNVVESVDGWSGYTGPSLLDVLELLPVTTAETELPLAFPVQWVEKFSASSDTSQGRRVFWGRVGAGIAQVGQTIKVLPSGQTATVAQVLGHTRTPRTVHAGHSAGIVLDREVDVSRGDWLLAVEPALPNAVTSDDDFDSPPPAGLAASREISGTVAWMDDEPLVAGRVYWALHGHRWVKARVKRVIHRLDINTLAEEDAGTLPANSIGHVELLLQDGIAARPYEQSRVLGALVLVDTASHRTAGALLIR